MMKTLALVMVMGSLGVARAGEPPQAVDADGVPVHPPGVTAPLPPGATEPLPPAPEVGDDGPSSLSVPTVVGEVFIGGLFEVGGAIAGGYIGYNIEMGSGCTGELCGLGGIAIGGLAGAALAAPVGVYLVGSTNDTTGSFGAALGGSALGTLAGIGVFALTDWSGPGGAFLIAAPTVGAVIGFNATRTRTHRERPRAWVPVAGSAHGMTSLGVAGWF